MNSNSMLLIECAVDQERLSAQEPIDRNTAVLPLRPDEIRLIRLLPRSSSNRIRFETIVVLLDSAPEYFALSYTWSAPPDDFDIEMDGRKISVRKNLWRFLDQLSRLHVDWPSCFWIDSLCINQANMVEKTRQIGQMGRIYHQASSVVAWLGPSHSDSALAMTAIKKHALHPGRLETAQFWSAAKGVAVVRLSQRIYWTRLWIFQELMLAQKITLLCGNHLADWQAFVNLLSASSRTPGRPKLERNTDYQAVSRSPARSLIEQSLHPLVSSLWDLMFTNRAMNCREPRDRVFALLGVAQIGETIVANYEIPLCRLVNDVLKARHQERPPRGIEEVAYQCTQLTDLFGLESSEIYRLASKSGIIARAKVKNVVSCPLGEPDMVGMTAWWAAFYGHDVVQWLLSHGKERDLRGPYRKASSDTHIEVGGSLMRATWSWAVCNGEADVVRVLLHSGRIDPSEELVYGRYSLVAAIENIEIVQVLAQVGSAYCRRSDWLDVGLNAAARCGHIAAVQRLWDEGARIENEQGSALVEACAKGHNGVVRILLQRGARVNYQQRSDSPTALEAAFSGPSESRLDVVTFLLVYQADPDVIFISGWNDSALKLASSSGHLELVRLLLRHGADVKGWQGDRALDAAKSGGHEAIVDLLRAAGARHIRLINDRWEYDTQLMRLDQ
ncbi:hypothetical protein LTR10_011252 [Elasticomyces elasticus]|nr:hypothetical protein LTR10_011252 [Elasticomyces elasticus]KAK4966332.1 hypothetical protein LTR42_011493 [Elasticomyces elasticus]